jgi:hypothetical protein
MNAIMKARFEAHRTDYENLTGEPFAHFHCPILCVDEPAELCLGHVINKRFKSSDRAKVIQRKDVDSFYGTHFEADFLLLTEIDGMSPAKVYKEKKHKRSVRPTVWHEDVKVPSALFRPHDPGPFTPVEFDDGTEPFLLGIKMSPEELIATQGDSWAFEMKKDLRVQALVSLIKSAHLTLFHILGYNYALSADGLLIGRSVLGSFFLKNRCSPREEVKRQAVTFFREFQHAVRPLSREGTTILGTVSDQLMLLCAGSSGNFWGVIVFARTSDKMHAVLLPMTNDAEAAFTYHDFMRNDNELITTYLTRFDTEKQCWFLDKRARRTVWTKSGVLFPDPPS